MYCKYCFKHNPSGLCFWNGDGIGQAHNLLSLDALWEWLLADTSEDKFIAECKGWSMPLRCISCGQLTIDLSNTYDRWKR